MKKRIPTGKFRQVEVMKVEYYCDNCNKRLNKDNPKKLGQLLEKKMLNMAVRIVKNVTHFINITNYENLQTRKPRNQRRTNQKTD